MYYKNAYAILLLVLPTLKDQRVCTADAVRQHMVLPTPLSGLYLFYFQFLCNLSHHNYNPIGIFCQHIFEQMFSMFFHFWKILEIHSNFGLNFGKSIFRKRSGSLTSPSKHNVWKISSSANDTSFAKSTNFFPTVLCFLSVG